MKRDYIHFYFIFGSFTHYYGTLCTFAMDILMTLTDHYNRFIFCFVYLETKTIQRTGKVDSIKYVGDEMSTILT